MISLRGLVAGISSWVAVVVAAVFVIQLQCGRIDKLQQEKANLGAQARADSIYAAALQDTLRGIGEYKRLAETVFTDTSNRIIIPPAPELAPANAEEAARPYRVFYNQGQWDNWYRQSCTGLIEGDTTVIWGNKAGARVMFKFYYGLSTNRLNRLLVVPAGDWRPPPKKKPGFAGGLEWQLSNKGDLSIGADITWRKWGPAARIDFLHDDQPTYWGGIRRNF